MRQTGSRGVRSRLSGISCLSGRSLAAAQRFAASLRWPLPRQAPRPARRGSSIRRAKAPAARSTAMLAIGTPAPSCQHVDVAGHAPELIAHDLEFSEADALVVVQPPVLRCGRLEARRRGEGRLEWEVLTAKLVVARGLQQAPAAAGAQVAHDRIAYVDSALVVGDDRSLDVRAGHVVESDHELVVSPLDLPAHRVLAQPA